MSSRSLRGGHANVDFFFRRGIRENVDLHVYTPEPLPMPVAGLVLGNAVHRCLKSAALRFIPT